MAGSRGTWPGCEVGSPLAGLLAGVHLSPVLGPAPRPRPAHTGAAEGPAPWLRHPRRREQTAMPRSSQSPVSGIESQQYLGQLLPSPKDSQRDPPSPNSTRQAPESKARGSWAGTLLARCGRGPPYSQSSLSITAVLPQVGDSAEMVLRNPGTRH